MSTPARARQRSSGDDRQARELAPESAGWAKRLAHDVLVAAAGAVVLAVLYEAHRSGDLAFDFERSYLPAARALIDGTDLYGAATFIYAYPPLLAALVTPALLVPVDVAVWAASLLSLAAIVMSLIVAGVRDVRLLALAAVSTPALLGAQVANGSTLVCLLVALAWTRGAIPAGAGIAVKLLAWPLVFWLWWTEGRRSLFLTCAAAAVFLLVPWALVGFHGLADYPQHATANAESQAGVTYAIATSGIPADRVATVVLTVAALAGCWWQRADRARSFAFAIAAALAAAPVLWGVNFVLVMIALALQRPRLSAVWFGFLVLWLTPGTEWPVEWWSKLVGLTLVFGLLTWLGIGAPTRSVGSAHVARVPA